MTQRVLIVDDELPIRRALELNLAARGYGVEQAGSGESALEQARTRPPDLAIVDLGLPGIDGVDVIRSLRAWTTIPIVVLSARGGEATRVAALDAGADDYVTKPFAMDELVARVRAALRRNLPVIEVESSVITDDFTIDLATKRIATRSGDTRLTPTQWRLVELLVRNRGRLVTHRQLLEYVWGPPGADQSQYLRVLMAQIRQKLERQPSRPRHFITEPGVGYRFEV